MMLCFAPAAAVPGISCQGNSTSQDLDNILETHSRSLRGGGSCIEAQGTGLAGVEGWGDEIRLCRGRESGAHEIRNNLWRGLG
jgi:hypothetical protein